MDSFVSPAHACPSLAPKLQREPAGVTAECGETDRRSKRTEAGANRGNALIGKSVEISASDGSACLPPQIAQIAGMPRPADGSACRLAVETPKSDSESSASVRSRSDSNRESGALIRTGESASTACRPADGTSTSDKGSRVSVRSRSVTNRESGALIREAFPHRVPQTYHTLFTLLVRDNG